MDDLLKYRKNAKLDGLCDAWDRMWAACHNDKVKLIRLAMMQQSFPHFVTYSHNGKGVSKDYLIKEFGPFINGMIHYGCDNVNDYSYSMFVDFKKSITLKTDVSYFMWCANGMIEIEKTKCPHLYVGCDTTLHVKLNGFNSVRISLFDSSRVVIDDADDESDVVVYRYSDTAKVDKGRDCMADVRVFDKELRLQL